MLETDNVSVNWCGVINAVPVGFVYQWALTESFKFGKRKMTGTPASILNR